MLAAYSNRVVSATIRLDGSIFCDDQIVHKSDLLSVGDVVGVGLFAATQRVFFTRNGEFVFSYLLDASSYSSYVMYSCCIIGNTGAHVSANFGKSAFAYSVSTSMLPLSTSQWKLL
jgi:hypothetical protein